MRKDTLDSKQLPWHFFYNHSTAKTAGGWKFKFGRKTALRRSAFEGSGENWGWCDLVISIWNSTYWVCYTSFPLGFTGTVFNGESGRFRPKSFT